jgi:hypothetical protein
MTWGDGDMRKSSRLLTAVGLVVFSVTVADVLLAQIAKRIIPEWREKAAHAEYRVRNPVYHYGLSPNIASTSVHGEYKARYFTNSLSFRDEKPRNVDLDRSTKRIVVIGDSFTEGANLNFEDTYVGKISEVFRVGGYEVLNAAVGSYAPSIYYTKIKQLIEVRGLKISEVVVFLDLSDIWDEAKCYYLNSDEIVKNRCNKEIRTSKKIKITLAQYSLIYHTYRALKDRYKEGSRRKVGHFEAVTNWDRARWTVDPKLKESIGVPGLKQARARMNDLRDLLKKHKVNLTVAVYPWPDQIAAEDKDSVQV